MYQFGQVLAGNLISQSNNLLIVDVWNPQSTRRRHCFRSVSFRDGYHNAHKRPRLEVTCIDYTRLNVDNSVSCLEAVRHQEKSPEIVISGTDHADNQQNVTKSVRVSLLVSSLQTCSNLKEVRKLHAVAIKYLRISEAFLDNNLISAYVRLGCLVNARNVFDRMPGKNVVSWTAILNGYIKFGLDDEALRLYVGFLGSEIRGNSKTFVCLLNLCCRIFDFELGKQIHACLIKENFENRIVDSAVVHFYARFSDLQSALRMFDQMRERDVVSWTTIISACSQDGWVEGAFMFFSQMLDDGFAPNEYTVCSILKASGEEKKLQFGRQFHAAIVKKIYRGDIFIWTSLLDMYAKCGEIENARKVFDKMKTRNMVTWTSIISGYARNGQGEEAINLFRLMKKRKISANKLTMVSILKSCGLIRALKAGKELHAQIVKNITQTCTHLGSTLVWFYCKCGEYPTAFKVLDEMPHRDVVSWTAMISGCAHVRNLGHEFEALEFMKQMLSEGIEPNSFTYSSALKACATQENIRQGKSIHSSVQKSSAKSDVFVGSTLIDMYVKCGFVSDAVQVFDKMPERNLVSWKAMIVGYAKSGHCSEALQLMYRMQAEGIEVDSYVLSTVLSACGDLEWITEPSFEQCLHSS